MEETKQFIYSCDEHVDIAIDTIVDEHETFPVLTKIEEEEKLSTACEFCRNKAVYLVANE